MIEEIYFENFRAGADKRWTFNTNTCPLKTFEIDGELKTTDRPKMQEPGDWQSFAYLGKLLVHLAGDLIGDTSEEYIDNRLRFMRVICPPWQPQPQKNRAWGTLYIKYYGVERFKGDCTCDGVPDPGDMGFNPTVSEYSVTFKVFNPYWIGDSGNRYLI